MRRTARGGVAIALVASGVVACTTSNAPNAPRTAVVERTSVTSGVAASGSLAALTEQNFGFTKGGQLTAVNVKVGDHVTAGQVLATIDPFSAQQALAQQQAQLNAQQAALDRLTSSPVVGGNQDTLDQARTILSKTKDQADAVQNADQTAIDNANRQLDTDKKALDKAQDALRSAQSACDAATSSLASGSSGSPSTGSPSTGSPSTGSPSTGSSHSGSWGHGSSNPAMNAMMLGSVSAVSASTTPTACTQVASAQSAVASAKSTVTADRNAVDAAEQKKEVDDQSGKLSIANAQQQVVSAQNELNSSASDRQPTIAQQAATVAAAQSGVDSAARDLSDTTLRAPADAVVSALNGAVGEFVAPSSNTSALAPGSDATLPGTNGVSAAAGAAQGEATPTRPGGTQFIVLDDINEYQVVLAFSEADAANITSGQKVQLTFDAVPDLTLQGSVLSVSPTGTAISGVISYYVTVALPMGDPRLKSGMTAQAEVLTQETPNVLAVPSAAVHAQNGKSVVTVLQPDGTQPSVPVQTGATGDGKTQIVSGLSEGQQVVLPAVP